VQSEFARNALNRAGVDQQESCTKLCQELLEHLSLVPESLPLAPRLQAFLDNSDREHFGDIIADLLQAWASSTAVDGVQSSLALHFNSMRAIVKPALWSSWKGQCTGSWGWKCKGKGRGKAPDTSEVNPQPAAWEQEQAHVSMAYRKLPWFSAKVQSEFARNALNRAGVDQQESCTKLCQELLEHLSLVPESLPLAPRLQAFLDNSDREHFGDIIADLLQAWVASESMAGVQSSLALHQRSLRAIIKATLWNAWNKEHSDGWSRV